MSLLSVKLQERPISLKFEFAGYRSFLNSKSCFNSQSPRQINLFYQSSIYSKLASQWSGAIISNFRNFTTMYNDYVLNVLLKMHCYIINIVVYHTNSKKKLTGLERFSFECRKVIGFAFTTLRDVLKNSRHFFHPISSKTKTNSDSLVRVFPRFASATPNYFVLWLLHLIICVLCDWLEWLLWFWFYDTQLKTALWRV